MREKRSAQSAYIYYTRTYTFENSNLRKKFRKYTSIYENQVTLTKCFHPKFYLDAEKVVWRWIW